jgi:hypothetical protein
VNLELPFEQAEPDELDAFLARIDQELDALFLDEVSATLERSAAGPSGAEAAA